MNKALYLLLIIIVTFAVGFQLGCKKNNRDEKSTAQTHDNAIILPVKGMSCSACVAHVRKCLLSLEGVTKVDVSLKEAKANIEYVPEKTSPGAMVQTINKCGYKSNVKEAQTAR